MWTNPPTVPSPAWCRRSPVRGAHASEKPAVDGDFRFDQLGHPSDGDEEVADDRKPPVVLRNISPVSSEDMEIRRNPVSGPSAANEFALVAVRPRTGGP